MRNTIQSLVAAFGAVMLSFSAPAFAEEDTQAVEEEAASAEEEKSASETDASAAEAVPSVQAPVAETVPHMGTRNTYSMGTVQGTVQALDFNQGLIRLRSSGGVITLRSRPMDMADLNPGDVVALQYSNYNGALWVGARESGNVQEYAQFGTLTGNVTQVNKALGTVTVRGRTFRAHPEQLEQVIPGQFVSLGYANIAGTNWISGIGSGFQGTLQGGSFLP